MTLDIGQLERFLVKAKTQTYAGDGKEIQPQRPGFKELEFKEGDWEYRDSYAGFFLAPGQEIVRFQGIPIWAMAYNGGMFGKYHGDIDFAKQTFAFLKKALLKIEESRPFRGPECLEEGDWVYVDESVGHTTGFQGEENILYKGENVFKQMYLGGIIVPK